MAITALDTIKQWFKTHLKPTQAQFWATFDSFRHKSEKVPVVDVEGLDALLADIPGQAEVDSKLPHGGYTGTGQTLATAITTLNGLVADLEEADVITAGQITTLQTQVGAINTLLTSNDVNLDTVQELVDAIKTVQTSLSTILVNDLTTGGTTKALTAEMGKTLKGLVDALTTTVAGKQAALTDVNFGAFESALPTVTTIADTDKVPFNIGGLARMITWLNFKALFKTINSNSIFGSGNIVTPDMDTTTAQDVLGVKTFRNGMIALRNVANTFSITFTNAITAARTVTWPDKSGTVAMTSDVPTVSGTANYVPKFTAASSIGNSRVVDDGTNIGIGTIYAAAQTLGVNGRVDAVIGMEKAPPSVAGFKTKFSGSDANPTGETTMSTVTPIPFSNNIVSRSEHPNKDVYGMTLNQIYKQTGGSGAFNSLAQTARNYNQIACHANGNVYVTVSGAGAGVYMQTAGAGNFNLIDLSGLACTGICCMPNNDVYVAVSNGDIYIQVGGIGAFAALSQTAQAWIRMAGNQNGDVYVITGSQAYIRTGGTGNFTAISGAASNWQDIATFPTWSGISSNNVYTTSYSGSLWVRSAGTGSFTVLYGGGNYIAVLCKSNGEVSCPCITQNWLVYYYPVPLNNMSGGVATLKAGLGKGTGQSRAQISTGQNAGVSNNTMQVETVRMEFDENGNIKIFTPRVFADNSAALAGGLTAGMLYWTSTGEMRIVV